MSWEAEQDRIVREGRLYFAPPEMVFSELKELGRRSRAELFSSTTEALEAKLMERNDPLINIGLACYCTNKNVFTSLYKHSQEAPHDENDAIYKRNLRLGCLSNQTITAARLFFDFPRDVAGEQEILRILSESEPLELEALVSNPTVSDKLLEEIFSLTGLMKRLSEDRRHAAVIYAARNERISTNKEDYDSPDMGHYGIHKAIFRLLEIAPVEPRWFWVVYDLLGRLDPSQVHSPERIDHILERWKALKLSSRKEGEEMEGNFTHLPMTEELRCSIAALYGRGFSNKNLVYFGSPTAKDVALRCAYYGSGDITEKEMKAGYKRDKDVYVFAASFNTNIIGKQKLRKLYEEEQLGGDISKLYLKHFAALKRKRPYIGEPSDELRAEVGAEATTADRIERIEAAIVSFQSKLADWSSQLQTLKRYAIAIATVLAIVYWFKK
jgi:hypothetical protein